MNVGYVSYGLSSQSLLFFLLKLLAFVTVVALIIGVLTWIKDAFFKQKKSQESTQPVEAVNNESTFKHLAWILLAGLSLFFVIPLLRFVGGSLVGLYNLNGYILTATLFFAAKLLGLILIISLFMAAFNYLNGQYESGNLNFLKPNSNHPTDSQSSDPNKQTSEVITL